GFFNRRIGVHAMLVVQVNGFNSQPLQAAFARLADILRLTVDSASLWIIWIAHNGKLRRQKNFIALAFDGLTHQFFVFVWPVNVGGVEKINAKFQRAVDGGYGLIVVAARIKFGHTHAAETQRGHCGTILTKLTEFHLKLLSFANRKSQSKIKSLEAFPLSYRRGFPGTRFGISLSAPKFQEIVV